MSEPEPHFEPPEGFQPTLRDSDHCDPADRPDWLVGADPGTDFGAERSPLPARPAPALRSVGPPLGVPSVPRPEPPEPAATEPRVPADPAGDALDFDEAPGWAAAASSVPRLAIASRKEPPAAARGALDLDLSTSGGLEDGDELEGSHEAPAEPSVLAPQEPWWLIAVEVLATNRLLQVGLLAALAIVAAWTFWPRKGNQSTALAAIKQHPQRYEGQFVRVRGEVGDVFDIGQGYVYQLHQSRDTVVVFSPTHRPAIHDRLVVEGTVSTGYLDGLPRVALFETADVRAR